MEANIKEQIRTVFTRYLEANKCRKTTERYTILEAICDMKGRFTLEELSEKLTADNFIVSRATLYNTLRLLLSMRLVVKFVLPHGTWYEVGYKNENHCYQVCTVCGKIDELRTTALAAVVDNVRPKRFRKDGFIIYIYGVCSSCQSKMKRKARQKELKKGT